MAKVTLVIEDAEQNGKSSITINGDFCEPGKSYDEMVSRPTYAVAVGLAMIEVAKMSATSFCGEMVDEFGNRVALEGGQ